MTIFGAANAFPRARGTRSRSVRHDDEHAAGNWVMQKWSQVLCFNISMAKFGMTGLLRIDSQVGLSRHHMLVETQDLTPNLFSTSETAHQGFSASNLLCFK